MARKRANGEGCISREKSGRYRVSISVEVGGVRKRLTRTAWKHADAVAILSKLRVESSGESLNDPDKLTVAGFLKKWLADVVQQTLAENTHDSYRRAIEKHINPHVGRVSLAKFSAVHVQNMLATMSRDEVGSRTRQNTFAVLKAAMVNAETLRLIRENPCRLLKRPKHQRKDIRPFTLAEARLILSETVGDRWHAAFVIALTAGLRPGEILGLEWDAVDLKASQLRIEKQAVEIRGAPKLASPKTKSSIRTADITQQTVDALRDHRAILLKEGHAAGSLVFPAPEGGIESRGNFRTRVWQPLLLRLALEARGFHHSRHSPWGLACR